MHLLTNWVLIGQKCPGYPNMASMKFFAMELRCPIFVYKTWK